MWTGEKKKGADYSANVNGAAINRPSDNWFRTFFASDLAKKEKVRESKQVTQHRARADAVKYS